MNTPDARAALDESEHGELTRLGSADEHELRTLIAVSPEAYCLVSQEIQGGLLSAGAGRGEAWGWFVPGGLRAAVIVGSTIVPVETTDAAREAIAARLMRATRRGSAMAGFASEVLDLQRRIDSRWHPRLRFPDQPLFAMSGAARVEPDPLVRRLGVEDLEILYPAAVAMFTEELGLPPTCRTDDQSYRRRIRDLLVAGRAFGRVESDEVVFKAEVGVVGSGACQLQGVWVAPCRRGEGLAPPALAAVVEAARKECAPSVSLYANSRNIAALRTYARIGFRRIGTFATVVY